MFKAFKAFTTSFTTYIISLYVSKMVRYQIPHDIFVSTLFVFLSRSLSGFGKNKKINSRRKSTAVD